MPVQCRQIIRRPCKALTFELKSADRLLILFFCALCYRVKSQYETDRRTNGRAWPVTRPIKTCACWINPCI